MVECSLIVAASIAAYELLVGDFIWARAQEEARRASTQGRRGRGYDTFESRQLQMHGHRSLSPGGRGRGHRPPPRRASNEETGLLYPPRQSQRGDRDARLSEERYYSSPGDTRFASPGRGSSGDSTRRLFYKVILLALLSRIILLPVETFCFAQTSNGETITSGTILDSTLLRLLLRMSETLPDIVFASALGLLIIFCAQIAFAAMPPLTPESIEGSAHGDDDVEAVEDRTETDDLVGEGAVKRQDIVKGSNVALKSRQNTRKWCIPTARLSRTILASEKTFSIWNIILSIAYILVFAAALVLPLNTCEKSLWTVMVAIYSFLLLSLVYVAALLGKALRPGIVRRKNEDSLALRLVGTCVLIAIMLIDRVICYSILARNEFDSQANDREGIIRSDYTMSTIERAISESLPVLGILFIMQRKRRKEVQSDVLIIHSIMSNLFGSMGQLDNTIMSSASGEGSGAAPTRAGGLGSRRFQTYGGTRGDSFPPSSGNKTRRNMPRAASSSGSGPHRQQPSATDASASEGTKGGPKTYVM